MNKFVTAVFDNPNLLNRYEINKLGLLRKINSDKIYKIDFSHSYPKYSLDYYINGNRKKVKVPIHLIMAKTFLSNPNNLPIVDHIDRNKLNYSLNNLRYVDRTLNSLNIDKYLKNTQYIIKNSINQTFSYNKAKLLFNINEIRKSYKNKTTYKGLYWYIINPEVENYYKDKDLTKEQWINLFDLIQLSSLGVLKVRGLLTLGSIYEGGYRGIKFKTQGKLQHFLVHRLVAKYFINSNIQNLVVDHIDGNRLNNAYYNLRICSNKDNSNNPITRLKLEKRVYLFDLYGNFINEFRSVREASEKTYCSSGGICECCNGKRNKLKNYIFSYNKEFKLKKNL